MELVNTGRCVRNPLQHKDFRRFQNCRHRPQQTRKCQVRTRLEMLVTANSFFRLLNAGYIGEYNEKESYFPVGFYIGIEDNRLIYLQELYES